MNAASGSGGTTLARFLALATAATLGLAAAGDVQARKPPTLCDGIPGAPRGMCVAAERLGCAVPAGKHQKQCAKIAEKYEASTGLPPPWVEEPPVFPGSFVALTVDQDVYDLDFAGEVCMNGLNETSEGACNAGTPGVVNWPNDIAFVVNAGLPAVLVQTATCPDIDESSDVLARVVAEPPFEEVAWDGTLELFPNPDGLQFGAGETLVLQSCSGAIYKLGNLEVDGDQIIVQFERID